MLYITTRGDKDAFTSYRALCENNAPDNGQFTPFRLPAYSQEELSILIGKSFCEVIAEVLNAFFSAGLTGWDVDFCIGKNPVRTTSINHRICIAEMWHNSGGCYCNIVQQLNKKLCAEKIAFPSTWLRTAVRIAVLFATYSQMLEQHLITEEQAIDVVITADTFEDPIAVLYARKMGLPINVIICTCTDSGDVWDLIQRGEFSATKADTLLLHNVEHLVYLTLGYAEVARFLKTVNNGKVYKIPEEMLTKLNNGLFCTVVSNNRIGATLNSFYRSNNYIIEPYTALSYGGLQDYRAKTGNGTMALLLADQSPLAYAQEIEEANGLSKQNQIEIINNR